MSNARELSVLGNAPAFMAYASGATNVASGVWTKIALAVEEFDTSSNFDTGTSRFTPNVAGYYQINGLVNPANYYAYAAVGLFKNGTLYKYGMSAGPSGAEGAYILSTLVYLNGTTDYVELFFQQTSGSTINTGTGAALTHFSGFLARSV